MSRRRTINQPTRPTARGAVTLLAEAFGPMGRIVLLPDAKDSMTRERLTIDDLHLAVTSSTSRVVTGSFQFDTEFDKWWCYVDGSTPEQVIRLQVYLPPDEPDRADKEVWLVNFRILAGSAMFDNPQGETPHEGQGAN